MSKEIIVDLTNYKDSGSARVPEGRYRLQVEDAEVTTSAKGNQMVVLYLAIRGGDYDGTTIVDRLTLTEKALYRVVNFMQAIGMPTPKKKFKINTAKFVGKYLEADIADGEPYNGKIKSEIQGYLSMPKGAGQAESDDLDSLIDADDADVSETVTLTVSETSTPEEIDLDDLDLG